LTEFLKFNRISKVYQSSEPENEDSEGNVLNFIYCLLSNMSFLFAQIDFPHFLSKQKKSSKLTAPHVKGL